MYSPFMPLISKFRASSKPNSQHIYKLESPNKNTNSKILFNTSILTIPNQLNGRMQKIICPIIITKGSVIFQDSKIISIMNPHQDHSGETNYMKAERKRVILPNNIPHQESKFVLEKMQNNTDFIMPEPIVVELMNIPKAIHVQYRNLPPLSRAVISTDQPVLWNKLLVAIEKGAVKDVKDC